MSQNKPLVTIGIPTYNRADGYLRDALESAINQTYKNIEIVVSDNCSSDRTDELVTSYEDDRIEYFKHDSNIGANNNFNYCLKMASGDYFLLLHDDDMIDPDFVEACLKEANYDTSVGLIRTGMRIINKDGSVIKERPNKVKGLSTTDFFLGWFEGKTAPYLCNSLFNTSRLKEIGGFQSKTNLYQDVLAEVIILAKYGRVDVEDIKATFRRHEANRGSAAKAVDWREDIVYLLDTITELVPEEDRKIIRKKGARKFAKWTYHDASGIQPLSRKFLFYLNTYKAFNFQYSPLDFFYQTKLKPRLNIRYLKRKMMELIKPAGEF